MRAPAGNHVRPLLLNPYAWLIAVVVLALAVCGGYWWGHTAAATSCAAKAGAAGARVERAEDRRDANVEAIATATAAAVAATITENRGSTDESTERIRTVVVPGACRRADPVVVRELRAARDDVNAAIRAGLRLEPTGADPADR